MSINGTAPGELARSCKDAGVEFVHISTDYVFDGDTDEPYRESAVPNPIQEYGKSKLAGERAVEEVINEATIVRLSFVYGIHGDTGELIGFPAWVRNQLNADEQVPLFVDQRITPTRAGQAAGTILSVLAADATGTYQIACQSCVTPFEFGREIARLRPEDANLRKSTQDKLDRRADRPSFTCLDVNRIEKRLGRPQPTLVEDLKTIAAPLRQ